MCTHLVFCALHIKLNYHKNACAENVLHNMEQRKGKIHRNIYKKEDDGSGFVWNLFDWAHSYA